MRLIDDMDKKKKIFFGIAIGSMLVLSPILTAYKNYFYEERAKKIEMQKEEERKRIEEQAQQDAEQNFNNEEESESKEKMKTIEDVKKNLDSIEGVLNQEDSYRPIQDDSKYTNDKGNSLDTKVEEKTKEEVNDKEEVKEKEEEKTE